ncbi:protein OVEREXPRESSOR OF CATIONIC PEROXIDASE 3 isoform X2 [Malania oleifera]|uniref:protein OVEREXPRESSOR OF CATIONIC PEROXIDASE 3 isoform X2 n=1 Tax=Malania oleifera TaxID=397392 RepID=UPI0025AEC950|nr:protein OVEREXPRESSOR OF CATIONIC PEROXIDASE 3 isoform X2 [Malania oleifera]
MALAPSLHPSMAVRASPPPPEKSLFLFRPPVLNQILPRPHLSFSALVFSRRHNTSPAVTSSGKGKRNVPHNDAMGEEDLDEDAFDALFSQLEEDLKNDDLSTNDNDDEISEEDLAKLERELEEALGDDVLLGKSNAAADNIESGNDVEIDDEDEEETPVKLKRWQLRRLASALKVGRRKTSIKTLAADLCLDRAVVLELLRDPPPDLLMMSAALPEEPVPTTVMPETKPRETFSKKMYTDAAKPEAKAKLPVHVMQRSWSAQKRMKKVQVETLERVYRRTKRPTLHTLPLVAGYSSRCFFSWWLGIFVAVGSFCGAQKLRFLLV